MAQGRNWIHAAGVVWPILVAAGTKRETLTYEQVAPAIQTNPLSVGYALGPIQSYCLENRLAPLTVVVVGKTTGTPGAGFIAWDTDDLDVARDAVAAQNWALVSNPFAGFGPDDDESTLAAKLIADPDGPAEVYRQVRDRGIAQRIFRLALLEAYGEQCAMCGLSFASALEAAHIVPWGKCEPDERLDPTNGVLLCASHHRLLDSDALRFDANGAITYYDPAETDGVYSPADRTFALDLHGTSMATPQLDRHRPDADFIRRRWPPSKG